MSTTSFPDGSTQVQVSLSIRRIFAVDSVTQTFQTAFTVFTYHEAHPEDEIDNAGACGLVNHDSGWTSAKFTPKLHVGQAASFEESDHHFQLTGELGRHGRPMLLGRVDFVATIQQEFYLQEFPVDIQILKLRLLMTVDSQIAHLVPMRKARAADGTPKIADVSCAPPTAAHRWTR